MSTVFIFVILSIVIALLGGLVAFLVSGIRRKRISPAAAKLFALFGVLGVLLIFVLMMGVLKNLPS